MPHSLRVRLKNLQRKGELTEKDIDRIFKALEQEPCDDVVSRQAVLDTIEDCCSDGLKGIFCSYFDGKRFEELIKQLPSVQPKQKGGAE